MNGSIRKAASIPTGTMQSKGAHKLIFAIVWATIILVFLYFWNTLGIPLKKFPEMLSMWLKDFGIVKAALLYIFIYTVRPIILFPATLLTVSSGLIFGPWYGILFTIIGENFSANFAFTIARYMGRDWVQSKETDFIKKWDSKLRTNGLVTVLIMRFIYLPFDGVNYGCGLTSMKQRDFAIGTFLGILPGLTTFVLLGGAASVHASGMIMILGLDFSQRTFVLMLSAFFFVFGLLFAKYLKKTDACKV